jgi:type 1 glutamine amidotransferase
MKIKTTLNLMILFMLLGTFQLSAQMKRVLIFAKTAGYHHASIEKAMPLLHHELAKQSIVADTTRNDLAITAMNLKKYKVIIFLNTSGDILDDNQQKVIEGYVKAGGGFVGIHAATDTEFDWPWYSKLVGAQFMSHPKQQKATINVVDRKHPATAFLPEKWERTDEWYDFKDISPNIKVLAYLDESTYEGGKNGEKHPIIWYQEYDGGRAFYTGVGHGDESYAEPLVMKHIVEAVRWAGKMPKQP